jgi:PEP-CTERM motif
LLTRSRLLSCVLLVFAAVSTRAFADVIDFETFTGPSTFSAAGNAQTISVSTPIGNVQFSGGVILTDATNLPADETSVYGTANNIRGVTTGSGFTDPLTITFPVAIHNFFLDVLNGNTQDVTYEVADNDGHSASFTLIPNLMSGNELVGFAASGTTVTITAMTSQNSWDFFIDNIHFDEPLPPQLGIPEPASVVLIGAGLAAVTLLRRKRRA